MGRTHRLTARSNRWTGLCICFALIMSSLTLITPASSKAGFLPQGRNSQGNNRNAKKVSPKPPQPGAPALALPNLEDAKHRRSDEPKAPKQIESNIRSRRKPLESRHGRKVGDPLPPRRRASTNEMGDGSERVRVASAEGRGNVGTARSHHARTTRSLPAGTNVSWSSVMLLKLINSKRNLSNHSSLVFLRYPALHSDSNGGLERELHSGSNSKTVAEEDIDYASFNLLLPSMPQSGGSKIVFASNREGSMQIYVMNGDGSNQARLTYSTGNDDNPRWSPNGAKILFQSDRDSPATG